VRYALQCGAAVKCCQSQPSYGLCACADPRAIQSQQLHHRLASWRASAIGIEREEAKWHWQRREGRRSTTPVVLPLPSFSILV
jgi:hypothetical protein